MGPAQVLSKVDAMQEAVRLFKPRMKASNQCDKTAPCLPNLTPEGD